MTEQKRLEQIVEAERLARSILEQVALRARKLELEQFNRVMVGRELRMIELKNGRRRAVSSPGRTAAPGGPAAA